VRLDREQRARLAALRAAKTVLGIGLFPKPDEQARLIEVAQFILTGGEVDHLLPGLLVKRSRP
jgi:hypothetical protein